MKALIFLCLIAFSVTSHGAETPAAGDLDKRLRNVAYHPDDVVEVKVQLGIATYFLFAAGEIHETWYSGDPDAFVVGQHKNQLTFKPIANDIDTNLIVTTNKRVYNMRVQSSNAGYFGVRFTYPKDEATQAEVKARDAVLTSAIDPDTQLEQNTASIGAGAASIKPDIVFDNGTHTFFHYRERVEWPSIYRGVGANESLTQHTVKDNWLIVPRVGSSWTLRHGDDVVCIRNLHSSSTTAANRTNTVSPSVLRTTTKTVHEPPPPPKTPMPSRNRAKPAPSAPPAMPITRPTTPPVIYTTPDVKGIRTNIEIAE